MRVLGIEFGEQLNRKVLSGSLLIGSVLERDLARYHECNLLFAGMLLLNSDLRFGRGGVGGLLGLCRSDVEVNCLPGSLRCGLAFVQIRVDSVEVGNYLSRQPGLWTFTVLTTSWISLALRSVSSRMSGRFSRSALNDMFGDI